MHTVDNWRSRNHLDLWWEINKQGQKCIHLHEKLFCLWIHSIGDPLWWIGLNMRRVAVCHFLHWDSVGKYGAHFDQRIRKSAWCIICVGIMHESTRHLLYLHKETNGINKQALPLMIECTLLSQRLYKARNSEKANDVSGFHALQVMCSRKRRKQNKKTTKTNLHRCAQTWPKLKLRAKNLGGLIFQTESRYTILILSYHIVIVFNIWFLHERCYATD